MSEHQLRAIKWQCAKVLGLVAACTAAILLGGPL